jgi:PAS domain-containing protein
MAMGFRDSLAIQSIEDKLGCGFWKRNVGADEMDWSRGLFRLYGRNQEKEQASYTLMRESQHPEDRLTFQKIDGNVRAGTLFDREYRVVLPDGGTRRLAHRGQVVFNTKDEPAFDVALVWDVSERNQLLDEVLSDEKRIRVILDALDYFFSFPAADAAHPALIDALPHLAAGRSRLR